MEWPVKCICSELKYKLYKWISTTELHNTSSLLQFACFFFTTILTVSHYINGLQDWNNYSFCIIIVLMVTQQWRSCRNYKIRSSSSNGDTGSCYWIITLSLCFPPTLKALSTQVLQLNSVGCKSAPVGLLNHLIFFMNGTFNIISKAHKMGPNKTNNKMAELAIDISIAIDKTIPVGYVTSHCIDQQVRLGSVGFTLEYKHLDLQMAAHFRYMPFT